MGGIEPVSAVPWALLAGQLIMGLALGWGLLTNPLSYSYVRRLSAHPYGLEPIGNEIAPELVEELGHHSLLPWATFQPDNADQPDSAGRSESAGQADDRGLATGERDEADLAATFDVFRTPKKTVTLARNRATGSMAIMTRLSDDRILLTDNVLTVPHRRLIVNRSDHDDVNSLITSHRHIIDKLLEVDLGPVADDDFVFLEVLALEHDSLAALGPVVSPFLNLTGVRPPIRLLVTLDPGELLEQALDEPVQAPNSVLAAG